MPVVTIQMYAGRTKQQKAELAKAITEAVVRIALTTPEQTWVVFQDVPRDSWAIGGVLASDRP
ncbi:MAG: 4-oxalocrotonate tautomerase family protein [Dehalococcoidia bacterium]|nr:4-oxalocrotonate tautomerase family protein [Dehalococcoidia bacterium]